MTSNGDGVVRLRPSYNSAGYVPHDGGDSPAYVALPEAQHAALVRVVEAATEYLACGALDADVRARDWSQQKQDAWDALTQALAHLRGRRG